MRTLDERIAGLLRRDRLLALGSTVAMWVVLVFVFVVAVPTVPGTGRLGGGLFVYAVSVLDAYTWASRRAHALSR